MLNLIAGLLTPTGGGLICDGNGDRRPRPRAWVVFQNHPLLPWLSCTENVLLAVESVFSGKEPRKSSKSGPALRSTSSA